MTNLGNLTIQSFELNYAGGFFPQIWIAMQNPFTPLLNDFIVQIVSHTMIYMRICMSFV